MHDIPYGNHTYMGIIANMLRGLPASRGNECFVCSIVTSFLPPCPFSLDPSAVGWRLRRCGPFRVFFPPRRANLGFWTCRVTGKVGTNYCCHLKSQFSTGHGRCPYVPKVVITIFIIYITWTKNDYGPKLMDKYPFTFLTGK